MKIILSIKPEFANKIFEGDKKFEFRRSIFKNKNVSKVIVYASSPISKVIGEFEIGEILFKDLNTLWKETKEFSGITEDYFYDYFEGKENGFALEVKRVKRYKKELCIKESFGKVPPQSFAYIKEIALPKPHQ
jgi:predicted transcriptional regulator